MAGYPPNCRGYVLYRLGETKKERYASFKMLESIIRKKYTVTSDPKDGDIAVWHPDYDAAVGFRFWHAGIVTDASHEDPIIISRMGCGGDVKELPQSMVAEEVGRGCLSSVVYYTRAQKAEGWRASPLKRFIERYLKLF